MVHDSPQSGWIDHISKSLYTIFDSTRLQIGRSLRAHGLISTTYKDEHPFEKRKAEADRIRELYPDRVPVICERLNRRDTPAMEKKSSLNAIHIGLRFRDKDLTVSQFIYVIRKRAKIDATMTIFLHVKGVYQLSTSLIGDLYDKDKDEDNFLYINYVAEYTRGYLFICTDNQVKFSAKGDGSEWTLVIFGVGE